MQDIVAMLFVFSFPLFAMGVIILYLIQKPEQKKISGQEYIEKVQIKKFKKIIYPAKNFLRPSSYTSNFENVIFANKYCIVKFLLGCIIFYDKINDCGYSCNKVPCDLIISSEFKNLCKKFNFETKIDDADDIAHGLTSIQKTELTESEKNLFKTYSLKNMSVAELIILPGINIGKANKLQKFMKIHKFRTLTEFIDYAKISRDDAKIIALNFNNNLKLKLKANENE